MTSGQSGPDDPSDPLGAPDPDGRRRRDARDGASGVGPRPGPAADAPARRRGRARPAGVRPRRAAGPWVRRPEEPGSRRTEPARPLTGRGRSSTSRNPTAVSRTASSRPIAYTAPWGAAPPAGPYAPGVGRAGVRAGPERAGPPNGKRRAAYSSPRSRACCCWPCGREVSSLPAVTSSDDSGGPATAPAAGHRRHRRLQPFRRLRLQPFRRLRLQPFRPSPATGGLQRRDLRRPAVRHPRPRARPARCRRCGSRRPPGLAGHRLSRLFAARALRPRRWPSTSNELVQFRRYGLSRVVNLRALTAGSSSTSSSDDWDASITVLRFR